MQADTRSAEHWTAERVGEAVIEAFRALPHIPVYSPRKAEFVPVLTGQDVSPLDVLALSEHVLGRSTPERRILLIWARTLATQGDVGGSINQYCRERGMGESTFTRRRKRACALIAAELNRIGGEEMTRLEGLRRTAPPLADRVERL